MVVTLCSVWQTGVCELVWWLQREREGHVNVHLQQLQSLQPLLVAAVHTERRFCFQRWWLVERLVRCQVPEQSLCCASSDHSILGSCRAVPKQFRKDCLPADLRTKPLNDVKARTSPVWKSQRIATGSPLWLASALRRLAQRGDSKASRLSPVKQSHQAKSRRTEGT